ASAAWWRRRGDRPLPWSWRATCLAAVHGNHIVGSRSQIRRQSSRRRKHVIDGQIECSRQCCHQPVRRRILPLALDARQVGNGNVDSPRQFGERHLPLLTFAAKILSEGHALPPDPFRLARIRQRASLAGNACSLYVLISPLSNRFFQVSPQWPTRSSSPRRPVRPRTCVPPSALATAPFFLP